MNHETSEIQTKFTKLLNLIQWDLLNIQYQAQAYRKIVEAYEPKYELEIKQTESFWVLHLDSLLSLMIISLGKLYDTNSKAITLLNFIKFVEENVDKIKLPQEIDLDKLQEKKEQVRQNDNLVKKLIMIRGNIFAHKNEGQFLKTKNPIKPLTWDDFDELVNRGLKICSICHNNALLYPLHYSQDYRQVLKALKIMNIAYNFCDNIDVLNLDHYPDDVKAFRQEFYDEISYNDYKIQPRW